MEVKILMNNDDALTWRSLRRAHASARPGLAPRHHAPFVALAYLYCNNHLLRAAFRSEFLPSS
jgi:hypothetical protein